MVVDGRAPLHSILLRNVLSLPTLLQSDLIIIFSIPWVRSHVSRLRAVLNVSISLRAFVARESIEFFVMSGVSQGRRR